jgi:hypothetical protein
MKRNMLGRSWMSLDEFRSRSEAKLFFLRDGTSDRQVGEMASLRSFLDRTTPSLLSAVALFWPVTATNAGP